MVSSVERLHPMQVMHEQMMLVVFVLALVLAIVVLMFLPHSEIKHNSSNWMRKVSFKILEIVVVVVVVEYLEETCLGYSLWNSMVLMVDLLMNEI